MKKVFVSFASSNYRPSLKRIERQALDINAFDQVWVFDEHSLNADFHLRYAEQLRPGVRGFGYWCWKPQIMLQAFGALDDGDMVLYADAGCHVNRSGRSRLLRYFEYLSDQTPILAFQNGPPLEGMEYDGRTIPNWPNEDWTKEDLFLYFGVTRNSKVRSAQTFHATSFLMKKNEITKKFLGEWLGTFEDSWSLIDDSPSQAPNAQTFREHRHDQSIFSILCERYPVAKLSSCEIVYPRVNGKGADWATLKEMPIHGRRDLSGGIWWTIRKRFLRLLLSIRKKLR